MIENEKSIASIHLSTVAHLTMADRKSISPQVVIMLRRLNGRAEQLCPFNLRGVAASRRKMDMQVVDVRGCEKLFYYRFDPLPVD
jgi:hypothetical protein